MRARGGKTRSKVKWIKITEEHKIKKGESGCMNVAKECVNREDWRPLSYDHLFKGMKGKEYGITEYRQTDGSFLCLSSVSSDEYTPE